MSWARGYGLNRVLLVTDGPNITPPESEDGGQGHTQETFILKVVEFILFGACTYLLFHIFHQWCFQFSKDVQHQVILML